MPRKRRSSKSQNTASSAFVYIVKCADGTLYTGATFDVTRRVKQHNTGKGARYTAGRGPVRLVFLEAQADWSTALQRERQIKGLTRAQKLLLIKGAQSNDATVRSMPCHERPRSRTGSGRRSDPRKP